MPIRGDAFLVSAAPPADARSRCAPSTVTRLAARIGRHALLLQALALQHLEQIEEPVVLDHFETFVFSQEDRLGIATPVGQKSLFSDSRGVAWKSSVTIILPTRMPRVPPTDAARFSGGSTPTLGVDREATGRWLASGTNRCSPSICCTSSGVTRRRIRCGWVSFHGHWNGRKFSRGDYSRGVSVCLGVG